MGSSDIVYERHVEEGDLVIDVIRCVLLAKLYTKLISFFPSCIEYKSTYSVLSRWVMNEKRYWYSGRDPLLPDGHLANLVISDISILQQSKADNTPINFTEADIKQLCQQILLDYKTLEHPRDVVLKVTKTPARFVEMAKIHITSSSLNYSKYINVPKPIYRRLLNFMSHEDIASLAIRYDALSSYNNQLAHDPEIAQQLHLEFDVKGELFASAFNVHYTQPEKPHMFCSLFPDIEHKAGSVSSFFEFNPPTDGFYISNPPYDLNLMEEMAHKLVEWLNTDMKLAFLSVLPVWDSDGIYKLTKQRSKYGEFKGLTYMLESGYLKSLKTVPQRKASFMDKSTGRYIFPCGIHYVLLANYDFPVKRFENLVDSYLVNGTSFAFYKNIYRKNFRAHTHKPDCKPDVISPPPGFKLPTWSITIQDSTDQSDPKPKMNLDLDTNKNIEQ